jgi:predicted MFS family arabinose efflux permease
MFKEESDYDLNSRGSLYAVFLVGVIAPAVFIVSPGYIQGMVAYLGFDEQSAGNVMSVELWGMAITTILMTFTAHRVNWRLVIFWSLLLMFAANALCTQVSDHQWFAALRFAAGLGAGSIISLSFAAIGLTSNPDRNFGLLITWVLTYGAIVLVLMPGAYATIGMGGVLWFFALFPLVALPFVRYLPASGDSVAQVEADAVDLDGRQKTLALSAMFVYFAGQGVVWTYLFLIGLAGGLTEQSVATGLMFSQFAGIAGAFLAAMLGNRFGRTAPLTLGIAGGAVCLYFLIGEFSFLVFAAAVCIYNFAWNLTHPFLLAAMASFDRRGRVVVYAVAAQMMGIAVGPFLAASIIEENNLVNVNWLGGILFVVSLVLILPPVLTQAKLSRQE